jgi:hypothetical protein
MLCAKDGEVRCEHDYGRWPYTKWCKTAHPCIASFYRDNELEKGRKNDLGVQPYYVYLLLHGYGNMTDVDLGNVTRTFLLTMTVEDNLRGSLQLLKGDPAHDGSRGNS